MVVRSLILGRNPKHTKGHFWNHMVHLGQLVYHRGFPGGSDGKESNCNAGDLGSIPGLARSPGGGHVNPLQYAWLEKSIDRGAWWATVNGVTKSQTQLSDWANHSTVNHRDGIWHTGREQALPEGRQQRKKSTTEPWGIESLTMSLPRASRQSGSCLASQPQLISCSLLGFYVLATMVSFLFQNDCAGLWHNRGFPGGSVGKASACNAGDHLQRRRSGFHPWVRKIPWRRK